MYIINISIIHHSTEVSTSSPQLDGSPSLNKHLLGLGVTVCAHSLLIYWWLVGVTWLIDIDHDRLLEQLSACTVPEWTYTAICLQLTQLWHSYSSYKQRTNHGLANCWPQAERRISQVELVRSACHLVWIYCCFKAGTQVIFMALIFGLGAPGICQRAPAWWSESSWTALPGWVSVVYQPLCEQPLPWGKRHPWCITAAWHFHGVQSSSSFGADILD